MKTKTAFKFDQDKHTDEPQKIAVKCVYGANYRIKLILDKPVGTNKRASKFITNTQELKSYDLKRYATRYIYEHLGILPSGFINTTHNGKECDALLFDWFNDSEPQWNDSGNNYVQIKTLFETGKPLPLASLGGAE
tara:strand:+ start:446 stop:853 length:408 start_codon:yes stop_codon:yes gene_type:complete